MSKDYLVKDGGWKSRKLWFGVFLCLLMAGTAFKVNNLVYSELVFGLVSIYALFAGANSTIRYFSSRNSKSLPEIPPPKKDAKLALGGQRDESGQELG